MPGSTPTLRDMVKDALDRGQTLDQLAERAVDPLTGEKTSRGHFFDLAKGNVNRMPTAGRLRAVAAALGTPYEAVRLAAIAQWLPGEDAGSQSGILIAETRRLADETRRLADIAARQAGERGTEPESA